MFLETSYWKHCIGQLALLQVGQKVGLILDSIWRLDQAHQAVWSLFNLGIVARRQMSKMPSDIVIKHAKFDSAVAHYIWIWGPALTGLVYQI